MCNDKIKALIKQNRFFNYEIAETIGIAETTFCKWFRKPLTDEQQSKILHAIERLKGDAQ